MSCEKYKSPIADAAAVASGRRPGIARHGESVPDPGLSIVFDSELAAHLKTCPACRAELESQRTLHAAIDRGIAEMVQGKPSGDFAAHVRRRIAENGVAPRPWFAGWLPLTATAAVALVVLAVAFNIGRQPRPPQSVQQTPPAPITPVEKPREVAPRDTNRAAAMPSVKVGPRQPRPPQSAAAREPEVLVPREEKVAIARLLNANWSGKADGTSLTSQPPPVSDSLKPMTIEELKIPALEAIPAESSEPPKRFP